MADDANPRAIMGANNPPPDPTQIGEEATFDALSVHAQDLYLETGNFMDGAEIQNEGEAEAVELLVDAWKTFIEDCTVIRDKLKAPHTSRVNAIQEQFYPLIGDTQKVTGIAIRAKKVLLQTKTKWANKLEAERAIEAKRLRDKAIEKARIASEAARDASGDLAATEAAEDLFRDAQTTMRAATQAEKPAVKGLRDNWIVKGFQPVEGEDGKVVAGEVVLLRHYFSTNPKALVEACLELARADVRLGKRFIPGLVIENERRAV